MKEYYCSYEQSVKLKELGFDKPCENVYSQKLPNHEPFSKRDDAVRYFQLTGNSLFTETLYPAPRLDQAATWMRDEKDIVVIAEPDWDYEDAEIHSDYLTGKWYFVVWKDGERVDCNFDPSKEDEEIWLFDTYEQALSAGIDKSLELLTYKLNRE